MTKKYAQSVYARARAVLHNTKKGPFSFENEPFIIIDVYLIL